MVVCAEPSRYVDNLIGQVVGEARICYALTLRLMIGEHSFSSEFADWKVEHPSGAALVSDIEAVDEVEANRLLRVLVGQQITAVVQPALTELTITFTGGYRLHLNGEGLAAEERVWGLLTPDGLCLSVVPGAMRLLDATIPIGESESSPLAVSTTPLHSA